MRKMSIKEHAHLELMRDSERSFPEIQDKAIIRTALIWHCRYRSLAPVAAMKNLEELVIGMLPDASLEFLGDLTRLRYLRIQHMPKVTDLAALAQLSNIEVLSLSTTPGWDSQRKRTIVDSLGPISRLPNLKQLELFGVCPATLSLLELQRCSGLQSARFSQYPQNEVARFYRATGLADTFASEPAFQRVKPQ
jgi:hypothetical protein